MQGEEGEQQGGEEVEEEEEEEPPRQKPSGKYAKETMLYKFHRDLI